MNEDYEDRSGPLRICGQIPKVRFVRFFSKEQYAEDFINGAIRLTWLEQYQILEALNDPRTDKTEGTGHSLALNPYRVTLNIDRNSTTVTGIETAPGIVSVSSSMINKHYIACFTEYDGNTEIAYLRNKFAGEEISSAEQPPYVVINDVTEFTQRISKTLANEIYRPAVMDLTWFQVAYNKGMHNEKMEPDPFLPIYQKPKEHCGNQYYREREWRLAVAIRSEASLEWEGELNQLQYHNDDPQLVERVSKVHGISIARLEKYPQLLEGLLRSTPKWKEVLTTTVQGGFKDIADLHYCGT